MMRKLGFKHWEPENVLCSTLEPEKKGLFSLESLLRTPPIGLSDSVEINLIDLLRENVATWDSGKLTVASSALERHRPPSLQTIQHTYPEVFENSVRKAEWWTAPPQKQDVPLRNPLSKEIPPLLMTSLSGNTIEKATPNHHVRLSALLERCQQ